MGNMNERQRMIARTTDLYNVALGIPGLPDMLHQTVGPVDGWNEQTAALILGLIKLASL